MRRTPLLGLVISLVMLAVAVSSTSETVRARRNEQDRSLQAAVSSESALMSSSARQAATALSVMLVNPDVAALLDGGAPAPQAHRADLANVALTLATIKRASLVPASAACLDDAGGRQVVCGDAASGTAFPEVVGEQFVAVARRSSAGAASGVFLSPVTGQPTVAFLAPYRAGGRVLGVVHLDVAIRNALGSSLVVNDTPGVKVELASSVRGRVLLYRSASMLTSDGLSQSAASIPVSSPLGSRPMSAISAGHRAMVALLPLAVGTGHQFAAVAAIAVAPQPAFLNAWSTWGLTLALVGVLTLLASTVALLKSHRAVTRELTTDPLTRLYNRRALIADLPRVCQQASDEEPAFLWFFDLNGFKQYNDYFGHAAGDTLLTRLGERLRGIVDGQARAYRLGGDEFCVLVTELVRDPHELFQQAREALCERGGGFTVTCAAGAVELPRESRDATHALRLADRRMYQHKATSRGGAADLATSVLHAALAQRHPDLGEHSSEVAGDVEMLSRTLGLDETTVATIVKAGDLHDVGKLGIPDEIITKPGALTEEEWAFMKQHTVMGEKIIAAAGPSLEQIAPLVRASHERWDGGGYPDGLAGEEIPLGARIITICDSFHAMLDERSYKHAMSVEEALVELRRCAGTQFDPALVDVFCRVVVHRLAAGVEHDVLDAHP